MKSAVLLFLLILIAASSGCYLPLNKPKGYSYELVQPRFQDIPVPFKGGYEYIESRSFTYVSPASDSLRVAELRIAGDTRVDEIVEFYKKQMGIHDFELVKELPSAHVHKTVLTFKKKGENERCVVKVWRDGTLVRIQINIDPT